MLVREPRTKPTVEVDFEAVERLVAAQWYSQPMTASRVVVRFLGIAAVAGLGPVLVGTIDGGLSWADTLGFVRAEPWSAVGVPLALGVLLATFIVGISLHPSSRDVTKVATRVERHCRYLTEGRWIARVVLWGIVLGCAVGVPIGTLLASDLRPSDIAEGYTPLRVVLIFVGMTFLWTVPASFLFRFLTLRSDRPLLAPPD
jgi:hypothetical protein